MYSIKANRQTGTSYQTNLLDVTQLPPCNIWTNCYNIFFCYVSCDYITHVHQSCPNDARFRVQRSKIHATFLSWMVGSTDNNDDFDGCKRNTYSICQWEMTGQYFLLFCPNSMTRIEFAVVGEANWWMLNKIVLDNGIERSNPPKKTHTHDRR